MNSNNGYNLELVLLHKSGSDPACRREIAPAGLRAHTVRPICLGERSTDRHAVYQTRHCLEHRLTLTDSGVDADSGETLAVTNPATGATLAEIAKCGTAETQRAIDAAQSSPGYVAAEDGQRTRRNLEKMVRSGCRTSR